MNGINNGILDAKFDRTKDSKLERRKNSKEEGAISRSSDNNL